MQSTSTRWSSDQIARGDRTDAWEAVLSESYRQWQVPQRLPATFFAQVRKHDFAGAGIVETVCDPCAGRRTGIQVKQDDELYVGIQLTTAGRERFKIGDAAVEVTSGDLVVWTTGQAAEFEVMERLHKVTLMIPWSHMKERLPERKRPPTGGKIESRTGVGSLLAVHLLALSNEIGALDERVHASVSRSTLELIGIALSDQQAAGTFDASRAMMCRVQDYILQHLPEDDLSPGRVALANRISLRYLHMLFQRNDMTVSSFILESRLRACKQALSDSAFSRMQISEIAYRWGFNSMSHFCRTFKEKYGSSPGEIRREGAIAQLDVPVRARTVC